MIVEFHAEHRKTGELWEDKDSELTLTQCGNLLVISYRPLSGTPELTWLDPNVWKVVYPHEV